MRKLQITAIGEPADVLRLVEFQAPAPGPGQVHVEVQAATLNASDFPYISGRYFITPQPPSDVGAEGVGRVLAVGPGENQSLVGARVLLLPTYGHGTWATHLIAATTDIVVVPDDIDTVQLAMVGINPMTALQLLRDYGNPSMPDRWIGQTAGNSAVGHRARRRPHRPACRRQRNPPTQRRTTRPPTAAISPPRPNTVDPQVLTIPPPRIRRPSVVDRATAHLRGNCRP